MRTGSILFSRDRISVGTETPESAAPREIQDRPVNLTQTRYAVEIRMAPERQNEHLAESDAANHFLGPGRADAPRVIGGKFGAAFRPSMFVEQLNQRARQTFR